MAIKSKKNCAKAKSGTVKLLRLSLAESRSHPEPVISLNLKSSSKRESLAETERSVVVQSHDHRRERKILLRAKEKKTAKNLLKKINAIPFKSRVLQHQTLRRRNISHLLKPRLSKSLEM